MAADPGGGSRRRFALLGAGVAVAVLAGGPTLFVALQPVQVLPRLGLAPGFQLVDQTGDRLTSDDLKGGITLYGIHSGACGTDCDEVVSRMLALYDRIDETEADPFTVRLVSISPDPGGDDPTDFARTVRPDADPETWRFATADTAHLRAVVGEGFETWYVREDDGSVTYDPVLVLVDPLGVKRAVWRWEMPDEDGLVLHLRELAREGRATGAAHLAYEAAHIFACYTPY